MELMERRLLPFLKEVPFIDHTEQLSVSMEQAFNEAKQIERVGDTSLEAAKFQTAVSQQMLHQTAGICDVVPPGTLDLLDKEETVRR